MLGGGGGIIIPSLPRRDDLFFIVSIDGGYGACGFVVKSVNFSFRS